MAAFFRSQAAAYVLLPTAAACWAGNHILARAIAGQAPPASLSLARWIVVAAVVGVFAIAPMRTDWPKIKANIGALVFLGVTGAAAFGTLQFVALQYTTAINMGVVGSVAPAFIVVACYLMFGDRMRPLQLAGVGVSLIGVLAIVTRLHPETLGALAFNGGDLIIIANMVLWAVYSACLRLRPDVNSASLMLTLAVIAGLANLPFAAWEYASGQHLQATPLTAGTILYAALFTTLLAYVCWNKGIELVGAPRASAFLHTIPVFSAVLATTILGESLQAYHLVGFMLILAGVTLAARRQAKIVSPAAPAE